jgi:hypothetical protein
MNIYNSFGKIKMPFTFVAISLSSIIDGNSFVSRSGFTILTCIERLHFQNNEFLNIIAKLNKIHTDPRVLEATSPKIPNPVLVPSIAIIDMETL